MALMRPLMLAASLFSLAAGEGAALRGSRRRLDSTDSTLAQGLFVESGEGGPIGNSSTKFECGQPGEGTASVAVGPGGCLNAQPGIPGFNNKPVGSEVARSQ